MEMPSSSALILHVGFNKRPSAILRALRRRKCGLEMGRHKSTNTNPTCSHTQCCNCAHKQDIASDQSQSVLRTNSLGCDSAGGFSVSWRQMTASPATRFARCVATDWKVCSGFPARVWHNENPQRKECQNSTGSWFALRTRFIPLLSGCA